MSVNDPSEILNTVREHKSRFRWLGIALVVLGALAILFPLVASLAAKVMIGWLFLVTGAMTLWHAFQARSWRSALWSGLIGLLYLVAGAYLVLIPLAGLLSLTILLAALFAVEGVLEIAMAFQNRGVRGNWWLGASGVAALVLAVLLILGLPGTALWALGLIVGINLLSTGLSFLMLAQQA